MCKKAKLGVCVARTRGGETEARTSCSNQVWIYMLGTLVSNRAHSGSMGKPYLRRLLLWPFPHAQAARGIQPKPSLCIWSASSDQTHQVLGRWVGVAWTWNHLSIISEFRILDCTEFIPSSFRAVVTVTMGWTPLYKGIKEINPFPLCSKTVTEILSVYKASSCLWICNCVYWKW